MASFIIKSLGDGIKDEDLWRQLLNVALDKLEEFPPQFVPELLSPGAPEDGGEVCGAAGHWVCWSLLVNDTVKVGFANDLLLYLVQVEGDVAVRESLLEISGKQVQRTNTANVADHSDVLPPVVCPVVKLQSPSCQSDVKPTEAVLDVAVDQVAIAPVVELVVAGVGLCLRCNTFRKS